MLSSIISMVVYGDRRRGWSHAISCAEDVPIHGQVLSRIFCCCWNISHDSWSCRKNTSEALRAPLAPSLSFCRLNRSTRPIPGSTSQSERFGHHHLAQSHRLNYEEPNNPERSLQERPLLRCSPVVGTTTVGVAWCIDCAARIADAAAAAPPHPYRRGLVLH